MLKQAWGKGNFECVYKLTGCFQLNIYHHMGNIISKTDILKRVKAEKEFLRKEFGVINIGLFGSFAKDQQKAESDIDFIVEFSEPRFEWLAGLQVYMEKTFDHKIELVRKRNLIKSRFLKNIEKDVIYV